MDANAVPPARPPVAPWRPENCDRIALVLQGGGALGAYQAGVYQALHEAGLEPDYVAGVSIGSINSAIIAGNPPERRLERLREFWEMVTARHLLMLTPDGDDPRRAHNSISALVTTLLGQPGFFKPNVPNPWLSLRGSKTATSIYDTAPLRETLLRLVDFDIINSGRTRFACGAVNVLNGNFYYFDNSDSEIVPEHVMASGALPPALPMVQVGTDYYWDGGLVSNTPLQHLLEHSRSENSLVFQVDLFSASGVLPRDMYDVLARAKDIQYSSRTRMITDVYRRIQRMRVQMKNLIEKIPEQQLSEDELAIKRDLEQMPHIAVLHLIYQQAAYEGQAKDYEFSGRSMREHWDAGYRDTNRTLRHREWIGIPEECGLIVHDVHVTDD